MRKFIVSSLAVVAIAAGGFVAHSAFNISVAQAQAIVEGDDTTTGTISTLGGCYKCIGAGRGKSGSGNECSAACP